MVRVLSFRGSSSVATRSLTAAISYELRAERDLPPLPPVSPHALRRTYISLLIEAGAPLPYVMRQVGHEDSRTTLEVYAQVQQRLSRKQVHQAFDDLLASAGEAADVPTDGREKMTPSTFPSSPQPAEIGHGEGAEMPRGPQKSSSEDDAQPDEPDRKPRKAEPSFSGARGTRTPDLLGAIQALSQLSYSPVRTAEAARLATV